MSTVRTRSAAAGAALALTAGILTESESAFGSDLARTAVLGVAVGAVAGLVPDRSLSSRALALVGGVGVGWLGYAVRAGFLPDIAAGRAIAAGLAVALVTVMVVASSGRLPLWSGLLGLGALAGAYETTFAVTPTSFVVDSTTAVTCVLVTLSIGLLVATAAELLLHSPTPPVVQEPVAPEEPAEAPIKRRVPKPRASADAATKQGASR